jgi:Zn-dependent protease
MIDLLLSDPARFLQQLVLLVPAFLIAVTVHELAHGLVADRLGDPTARAQGRLTLNPLPHIDPLGAIAFLLAGFGWARPVPVNAYNLKHPRRDMAWIAAAGPLSNFAIAFLGLVALVLTQRLAPAPFLAEPLAGVLIAVFRFNLALAIFNLIPLPPLDGGHFLPYFLPGASWTTLHRLEQYGPMVLLLLVMSGATRYVVAPVMGIVAGFYFWVVRLIFGI